MAVSSFVQRRNIKERREREGKRGRLPEQDYLPEAIDELANKYFDHLANPYDKNKG